MILHVMLDEKFTAEYIALINNNFDCTQHLFLVMSSGINMRYAGAVKDVKNVTIMHKDVSGLFKAVRCMISADKIILHGMFTRYIVYLIAFFGLSHKTYWYIWGGDLYDYYKEDGLWKKAKIKVISNLKGIITPLEGDYLLAKKVYHASCGCFPCLLPSTSVRDDEGIDHSRHTRAQGSSINILLGNSADIENNHIYLLDKLKVYANDNVKIYIPLSYGDQEYADKVERYASEVFGSKTVAMRKFMPLSEYKEFLKSIDVAVYAHKRQQAFGNIIHLLLDGVKVYLDTSVSTWSWMEQLGIKAFDVDNVDKDLFIPLSEQEKRNNEAIIRKRCSQLNMINEWKAVFKD